MEAVREFIDANRLMSVMTLPEHFKDCRLEVIVIPVEERVATAKNASDIDKAIRAISGAVPYTDMSLAELREERLQKYENID